MITFSELTSLKLFNDRAEELLNSGFVKYVYETGKLSASITVSQNNQQMERILPDKDAIKAFVLTFRFFIQDRDNCSFRVLSKTYEKLPISPELKKKFVEWRKALNDYLDKKSSITVHGKNPSNKELYETFIYGELSHFDPKKKAVYDSWKERVAYPALEVLFCSILEHVLRAIRCVAEINKKVIAELEK